MNKKQLKKEKKDPEKHPKAEGEQSRVSNLLVRPRGAEERVRIGQCFSVQSTQRSCGTLTRGLAGSESPGNLPKPHRARQG